MRCLAAVLLALLAVTASAEPYAVGTSLRAFSLEDQYGIRGEVDTRVRLLLLTRDMDGGDLVKRALADVDQKFLDERRAVYIADIARMPALVSKLVAVPRMRKRPYRVVLDRDGSATRDLPYAAGKATAIFLDDLRITRIAYLATAEEVRAAVTEMP